MSLSEMQPTVQELLDIIEQIAPAALAEEWDNVGLMIGSPGAGVEKILLGLDPTLSLLAEAEKAGANLLITHHPFIFHPLKSVWLNRPEGIFVEKAIQGRINVIGCHTNLDNAAEGVSRSLVRLLGLEDEGPLVPAPGENGVGLGRIGSYPAPVPADSFTHKLREACSPPWLLTTGNRPDTVSRVAVCGGSGSEFAPAALAAGAQVYVTGEVKHSVARWAEEAGLWLVDAGHFATERQALAPFADQLRDGLTRVGMQVEIHVSLQQEAPLCLL
ncbi:MAG: Nif3-like dinuclear metal center hexameric protein [Desulfobulbaceae bacterium]